MPFKDQAAIGADETRAEEQAEKAAAKICLDCKHCLPHPSIALPGYALCGRPGIAQRTDPVSGEAKLNYCSAERITLGDDCGEAAQYFEPIPQKDIDWWTARMCWQRFMFQDAKDRGWDAEKAHAAQKALFEAKDKYEAAHGGIFNWEALPTDVSEKCPPRVDSRIEI